MQWWVVPICVGVSAVAFSVFTYTNTLRVMPVLVNDLTTSRTVCLFIVGFQMIAHAIAVGAVAGVLARFCRVTQTELVGLNSVQLFVGVYLVPAVVWYKLIAVAERHYYKKHPKVIVTEE